MTKTTELADQYACEHYSEYSTDGGWSTESDYEAIEDAYKNGAHDMLERVLKYLEVEHPTFFDHFGEEIRKAMK
jgi:hypothetical protein